MTNTLPAEQTKPTEQPEHAKQGCCSGRDRPATETAGVDIRETVTARDDKPAASCCGGTSDKQH